MAPEQARGEQDIGPAADVFSLGCVLFECLTGQPPFTGEHIAAVLAKILFDDAPRLRSLRAELPEVLERLLQRLLHKDAGLRPPDAQAVLAELDAVGPVAELEAPPLHLPVAAPKSLPSGEQQLVSVLYASQSVEAVVQPTLAPSQEQLRLDTLESLRTALLLYDVRAEPLADGSLVATVTTTAAQSTATDQAALAARAALVILEQWPAARVAISTGKGVLRAALPIGEAVDRAVRLLASDGAEATLSELQASTKVVLDATTAGLLDARFELAQLGVGRFALLGEHLRLDVARPLLGKPTPCVGREQELAVLSSLLNGCIDDSWARALTITAPSGLGKSRLRHEFLRLVEQRPEEEKVTILYGRADPTCIGSPYALFAQALRRFLDLDGLPTIKAKQERLRARVADRLPANKVPAAVELFSEILNLLSPEDSSPILRGTLVEPRRMADMVSSALIDLLHAECALRPVLLVLEDLQWADTPSLWLSETILRALDDQPILVVGLTRPEVEERFPRLWHERRRQEIRLSPLGRRASERLVRQMLGPKVAPATVNRIVEQAAGNALFLEELPLPSPIAIISVPTWPLGERACQVRNSQFSSFAAVRVVWM